MADESEEETKKASSKTSSANSTSQGHAIPRRNFNLGEAQTLLELAQEFGQYKVTVKTHTIGNQKIVDMRTTTPELAKFIDFLLTNLRMKQIHLNKVNPDICVK